MRLPALALTAALTLTACGGGDDSSAAPEAGRLDVVVGLYPYAWLVERIGGDAVEVVNLAGGGAEPHDLELTPQQVGAIADADLVVRSAGFSPALDEAVASSAADRDLDVLELVTTRSYDGDEIAHEGEDDHGDEAHAEEEGHGEDEGGHDHGSEDPHLWLDPVRLAEVAEHVAEELAERSGDDRFLAAAADLRGDLESLDAESRAALTGCQRDEVFTAHDAFGYVADRYALTQVPVSRSAEEEPSPRRLAEVAEQVRASGATTVFTDSAESTRVADQLARETGTEVALLSPLELAPEEGDYLTAMRDNLAVLTDALGCA